MRRSALRATMLATAALLTAGCGDPEVAGDRETTGDATEAATEASPSPAATSPTAVRPTGKTEPPTAPAEPSPTATMAPDGGDDGTAQTFIVAPQEPRDVAVGREAEFSVGGTYDDREIPDRLWVGVVPCADHDLDAGTFTSSDATADGFDADVGPRIHDVNGEQYENVDDIWPTEVHVQDGVLTFTVLSDREACAIPTVFDDTNGNGELDVDPAGAPVEPYGVGKATWG